MDICVTYPKNIQILYKAHLYGCSNLKKLYKKGKIHYVGEVMLLGCLQF